MRSTLFVTGLGLLAAAELSAQTNLKLIHAFLTTDNERRPTTQFSPDAPRINVFWKGEGLDVGDKIRAAWMAEDVGGASAKETKISEKMLIADKRNPQGSFFLARPAKQTWPIGKYRLDFFVNERFTQVVKFTVAQGPAVETKPPGSP